MFLSAILRGALASLVYSLVGIALFAMVFFVINKTLPFSLRKEIEDDQNVALAIVLASVFIGISMIVSATVHG